MLKFLFAFSILFCAMISKSQEVSYDEILSGHKKSAKILAVKVGATWCNYCKLQDKQIDLHPDLENKLTNDFVFLDFNAETLQAISFKGQTYHYMSSGNGAGINTLALEFSKLLNKKNGYPMWLFFDRDLNYIDGYAGYLPAKTLMKVLEVLSAGERSRNPGIDR